MVLEDEFTSFVRDIFVLVRSSAKWDGHDLQQAVAQVARARTGMIVQGPGGTMFFGRPSASRLQHEIDAGLQGQSWVGFVEVKATATGPTKNDILIFDGKTLDLYIDRLLNARHGPHYRLIASAAPIDPRVRGFCYQRGIVCVEPDLVPLPVLAKLLEGTAIERLFDDVQMQEADRLFAAGSAPMERVWTMKRDHLTIRLSRFSASDLDDVGYLQARMSDCVLNRLALSDSEWEQRHLARLAPRSVRLAMALDAVA